MWEVIGSGGEPVHAPEGHLNSRQPARSTTRVPRRPRSATPSAAASTSTIPSTRVSPRTNCAVGTSPSFPTRQNSTSPRRPLRIVSRAWSRIPCGSRTRCARTGSANKSMLPTDFRNSLRRVIVFCFINFAAETRGRLHCTKPDIRRYPHRRVSKCEECHGSRAFLVRIAVDG